MASQASKEYSAIVGLILFVIFWLVSPHAWCTTPPNSLITNTALATYHIDASKFTENSTSTLNTAACSAIGIKVDLLHSLQSSQATYMPMGANIETVMPASYAPSGATSGPFAALGNPVLLGNSTSTVLPTPLLLSPLSDASGKAIASYSRNEPIFVRVIDYDANLNASAADTVFVKLVTSAGDSEVLQLTETGLSTGVFVGAIQSEFAAQGKMTSPNDGKITLVAPNETISVTYNHPNCSNGVNIASINSVLIDPYGMLFDSKTGESINGAEITLINALSNQQATVYCDDGITVMPQPLISGFPTLCDSVMAAGSFRFPKMVTGQYKLAIRPPPGHVFPSSVAPVNLPVTVGLPAAAPIILGTPGLPAGGSYGGEFPLAGTTLKMDIPLDPSSISINIQKSVGIAVAGIGEFVPYTLTLSGNSASTPLTAVLIADYLPFGFRYQKGSVKLNGLHPAEPKISPDGRILTFSANIAVASTSTLTYVVEVTSGAYTGTAENTAAAVGGVLSNTAHASILVREDLYSNKAILIGRVVDAACSDKTDLEKKGLNKARIVLEEGSTILSDSEGRWHIDNVRPGTHVVQLDVDSLPKDYEVLDCENNSRFAGSNTSQFVNLRGGSLWRADFHVHKKTSSVPQLTESMRDKPAIINTEDRLHLVEKLPYDDIWLSHAKPGSEWLHPLDSFHPNLPVLKVAVKHQVDQIPLLNVNGLAVSRLLFDGTRINADHNVALSTWNAVPVVEGNNRLELVITDINGKEISRSSRKIHYAAIPDQVEFAPQQSRLIADGKTNPLIAVRILDKDGIPVRRGLSGDFQLNEPYRSHERNTALQANPLNGHAGGKARYEINNDGLALIELEPTTQSGDVVINFQFNDKQNHEVRAWLEPGQRDWILVGFGEGTLGHKSLSGNMQALQDADQQLFDKDKLAFYAKGTIRGDYLLTLAYDSSKQTGLPLLKQAVDPTQYYTLYADASQANSDASSASRLYLKLERKQFYALFGDFDTGLTVTELSRYSRTLNGVKSEFKGEKGGYNVFATTTSQAYVKDEIQGNGISGVYQLSRSNLIINSDKIRIETRDRFQSQIIISTQSLARYLDYDIDYGANNRQATLIFREPISSTDNNFNPQYIVAEYESNDPAEQKMSAGGRGSYKPIKNLEVGITLIHDGTAGAGGNLQGVDSTYQVNNKTRIHAELAATQITLSGIGVSGSAILADVLHRTDNWDSKIYLSKETAGFGMGQQATSEADTRKVGAEGRFKLSDTTQMQGLVYQQINMGNSSQVNLVEGKVNTQVSELLSTYYGVSSSHNLNGSNSTQSNQLVGGTTYKMPDKRFSLTSDIAVGNSAGSLTMPNRLALGGNYNLNENSKLFVKQEFARGNQISANMTSAGIRTQPWTGNEMTASVGNNLSNDAERLYANFGMVQRWQLNKHWQTSMSFERNQTLYTSGISPLNASTPLPYGLMGQSSGEMSAYLSTTVGAVYHDNTWSSDGRIEIRNSIIDQQRNLKLGMQHNFSKGLSMAAGYMLAITNNTSNESRNADLRISYAFRPNDGQWIWLDRCDFIQQSSQTPSSSLNGEKWVNNLNSNYMPSSHTQISFQYGSKYVLNIIDSTDYKEYTDLIGIEIRHDLTPDWDIGTHGMVMRSLSAGVNNYGLGASLGYKVIKNIWLSVGYNLLGLSDHDFTRGGYQARGSYLALRMKLDQESLGLNRETEIIGSTIPP